MLCGPTFGTPTSSTHATEPPPAPIAVTPDDRHHHRHAADVLARAHARPPVLDDRDVGAGAADVQRDDVRQAGLAGDVGGADHPRGGPGEQRRHRLRARGGHGHDAAVRLRDVRRGRHAARGERLLEALEVAPHLRLHVRVEHGQGRPLVLARLRPDVGRRCSPAARGRPPRRSPAPGARARGCDTRGAARSRGPRRSWPARRRTASRTLASSSGVSTLPSARSRSRTSATRARGIKGSGREPSRSNGFGSRRRCSSSTSRKPSVTRRPRRAPVRWISVFTAIVVPCTTVPISRRSTPCSFASWSRPARTASANSCGVDGTFRPISSPRLACRRARSR